MKIFLKVFLGAFLAYIVFANPFKSCHPVEPDEGSILPQKMEIAPVIADTEVAEKVYYTEKMDFEIPRAKVRAITVQDMPQNYTEVPLPPLPNAAPTQSGDISQQRQQNTNPWDSLINGGLGVGILGLLGFVVKSDRETLKKFSEAVDQLADSNSNTLKLLDENRQAQMRIETKLDNLINKP
jgi:hypothetical protein